MPFPTSERLKRRRDWPVDARALIPPADEKTVLFFGAGASTSDGVPIQSRLLEYADKFCMAERPSLGLAEDWQHVRTYMARIAPGARLDELRLEDYLTFLDKATQSGEVVGGAGPRDAHEPRRALLNCIANLIDGAQDGSLRRYVREPSYSTAGTDSPMRRLGSFLRASAANKRERWSIISTNWDTTLDFALENHEGMAIADYCTYSTPWERYFGETSSDAAYPVSDVPSLWKRPLNYPAAKVLKLHGSLNWLWCPTCSRLFTSTKGNIALHGTSRSGLKPAQRRYCPECWNQDPDDKVRAPLLREVLITPTMLKRLDMVHLRMVWYNALIEIAEARKVVFVGYSAPPADYEVRYLLAKAFSLRQKRPEIRVVTRPGGDTKTLTENYRSLLGSNLQVDDAGIDQVVTDVIRSRI